MKNSTITQSPYVLNPFKPLPDGARKSYDKVRIDDSFEPYTVIDVLQKVFHREFKDDLIKGILAHPDNFKRSSCDWRLDRIYVNNLKIIRPESIYFQNIWDFQVDILSNASIFLEEVRTGDNSTKLITNVKESNRGNNVPTKKTAMSRLLRLRYSFDLRPCHMTCQFVAVILEERESLIAKDPYKIPVDKYFIPVLKGSHDYNKMAKYFIRIATGKDGKINDSINPFLWAEKLGTPIKYGVFSESNTLGEYYFDFGEADVINQLTGSCNREAIQPGTIILNKDIICNEASRKTTLAHELIHHVFGRPFFLLQKMHGRKCISYLCKREFMSREQRQSRSRNHKWTPIDILELQANKLPGYLLINEENGRRHANRIMFEHYGRRDMNTMRSMVDEMAAYFGTTKTLARTRLIDFGYDEARGFMQSANGELIPAYISNLKENETYTIDEADGIREYIRNDAFREIIDTGKFLYVEGHYCLIDRKYIYTDRSGIQHLTHYAREHMDECCLVFERVYQKSVFHALNGILRKGIGKGRHEIRYRKKDGTSVVTEAGRQRMAMIRQHWADKAAIELDFNQMLVDLMERRGMTIGQLAEETGLSRETIKRMRNDRERVFQVQDVVAVSIALSLPPEVSRQFLLRAPCGFLNTDEMHAYQYMLTEGYLRTVPEVNRMLVEMGVRPLTNLVAGFDEAGVMEEESIAVTH